jgi:molybdopterin synthase sulfur carrier subunit
MIINHDGLDHDSRYSAQTVCILVYKMKKDNISITLVGFGIARDILGQRQLEWSFGADLKLIDLKKELIKAYPELQDVNGFQLAIGDEYGQDDDIIPDQAVVSILPPVSGG